MSNEIEVGVWWCPQVPMTHFERAVRSVSAGRELEDVLAQYDLFQLKHNVKPDFCNAGGTRYRHIVLTEGEWWDVPDDQDDLDDIIAEAEKHGIDATPLKT